MFCLNCGTKIAETDRRCSKCGMTVSEMKARIAQAEEMLTYAETVGPASTTKLPPVAQRTYVDREGNVFSPAEEIPLPPRKGPAVPLDALPHIGSEDPYVTMPIQRVVSDRGEVIADVNRDVTVFVQEEPKKDTTTFLKLIIGILLVLLVAGVLFVIWNWVGIPF